MMAAVSCHAPGPRVMLADLKQGPVVGKIFDTYGPRWLMIVGSFLHVFGLMMASISTEYYQILLSQGVCSAIGAASIFQGGMQSKIVSDVCRSTDPLHQLLPVSEDGLIKDAAQHMASPLQGEVLVALCFP